MGRGYISTNVGPGVVIIDIRRWGLARTVLGVSMGMQPYTSTFLFLSVRSLQYQANYERTYDTIWGTGDGGVASEVHFHLSLIHI